MKMNFRAYYNKKNLKLTISEFVLMKTLRMVRKRYLTEISLLT